MKTNKKDLQIGKLIGIKVGEFNFAIYSVAYLMLNKNMSLDKALDFLPYNDELKNELYKYLENIDSFDNLDDIVDEVFDTYEEDYKNNEYLKFQKIFSEDYNINFTIDEIKQFHSGETDEYRKGKISGLKEGMINIAIINTKFLINYKNLGLKDALNYFPYSKQVVTEVSNYFKS